jgi:hypothetical protein
MRWKRMSTEHIPSPEEIDMEIYVLKKALDFITAQFQDRIKSLEEAKEALKKSQQAGIVKYELPKPKPGQERLYMWLEGKLKEQQEKGHIQNLKIEVQEDKTTYTFNLVKKEDAKDIEGWFSWVKKRL